jgi:peptide/nickel transport system substrate-binding protein
MGEVQKEANLAVLTMPGQDVWYMPINVTKAPFDDIRVREAAAKAINQEEILASVFGGVGRGGRYLPDLGPAGKPCLGQREDQVRPRPRQCAAGRGGLGDGGGRRARKDGQPLKVSLWTQSDSIFRRLTEVVQAQLKAVGIEAEITTFRQLDDPRPVQDRRAATGGAVLQLGQCRYRRLVLRRRPSGLSERVDVQRPQGRRAAHRGDDRAKNMDERVANFTAYHEYVLTQFPMAPIYQPVQAWPTTSRPDRPARPSTRPMFGAAAFMDMEVKE